MANTSVVYTGNNSTQNFSVPFSYILNTHVVVTVNTVERFSPLDYTWLNASTIRFVTAPAQDAAIRFQRVTPGDNRLVDFTSGAVLSEADLDLSADQTFNLAQEAKEGFADLMNAELIRIAGALGIVTTVPADILTEMVATALDDEAAATLQQRVADIDANGEGLLNNDLLLALLGAGNVGSTAYILDTTTIKLDSDAGVTLASKFSTLVASDNTNAAAITTEQTVRANADSAMAVDIALMGVANGEDTAFIMDTATVQIGGGESWATRLTALSTADSDNSAAITSEATTRGNADDGFSAHYGVSLNVNGYVTGFTQLNDGSSGTFVILADKFAIVDPSGDPAEPEFIPFSVSGGVVTMQNVKITGNLIVDGDITSTQLTGTALADLYTDMGSIVAGDITLNSSGYIKGGQSAYNTGAGFFLGYATDAYKFSIGDGSANKLTWDGTTLVVRGNLSVGNYTASDTVMLSALTERTDAVNNTFTELKKFEINRPGTVRVVFDKKMDSITGGLVTACRYRILLDGVLKDSGSFSNTTYDAISYDMTVDSSAVYITIELDAGLRVTSDPIDSPAYIKNAYIKCTKSDGEAVITD